MFCWIKIAISSKADVSRYRLSLSFEKMEKQKCYFQKDVNKLRATSLTLNKCFKWEIFFHKSTVSGESLNKIYICDNMLNIDVSNRRLSFMKVISVFARLSRRKRSLSDVSHSSIDAVPAEIKGSGSGKRNTRETGTSPWRFLCNHHLDHKRAIDAIYISVHSHSLCCICASGYFGTPPGIEAVHLRG